MLANSPMSARHHTQEWLVTLAVVSYVLASTEQREFLLTELLQSTDSDERLFAVRAAALDVNGSAALAQLVLQALRDSDAQVRVAAAVALLRLGQATDEAHRTLLGAVCGDDGAARALALEELPLARSAALPLISRLLDDERLEIRRAGFALLARLNPRDISNPRALLATAVNELTVTGPSAELLRSLRVLGTLSVELMPILERLLEDDRFAIEAAEAITTIGDPGVPRVRRSLQKLLLSAAGRFDSDAERTLARRAAAEALLRLDPSGAKAIIEAVIGLDADHIADVAGAFERCLPIDAVQIISDLATGTSRLSRPLGLLATSIPLYVNWTESASAAQSGVQALR